MKVNIFKIQNSKLTELISSFNLSRLNIEKKKKIDEWDCDFYLSEDPDIKNIPWVTDYEYFIADKIVQNKVFSAGFLRKKGQNVFALTYGKAHFLIRKFCEPSFGLDLCKRIADEKDIRQKTSKNFGSKKKKKIESLKKDTELEYDSGEAVDHLRASIIETEISNFGERASFGSSVLISKEDLTVDLIPSLLNKILEILPKQQKFDIPKTDEIKNITEIDKYDNLLLDEILSESELETQSNSFEVVGVDFIFNGSEKYILNCKGHKSIQYDDLSSKKIKDFIREKNINKEHIFDIKVIVEYENAKRYPKNLKEFIEYSVEGENVILQNGKWIRFNEKYINQLNDAVSKIEIEGTEQVFEEISIGETDFNKSKEISEHGYQLLDMVMVTFNGHKLEVADLRKDKTRYALKFGNTQKLVYVCSQAQATLEMIRNKEISQNDINEYCLWFGIKNEKVWDKIENCKSLILKQQINNFAKQCRELEIKPKLKFSKKI